MRRSKSRKVLARIILHFFFNPVVEIWQPQWTCTSSRWTFKSRSVLSSCQVKLVGCVPKVHNSRRIHLVAGSAAKYKPPLRSMRACILGTAAVPFPRSPRPLHLSLSCGSCASWSARIPILEIFHGANWLPVRLKMCGCVADRADKSVDRYGRLRRIAQGEKKNGRFQNRLRCYNYTQQWHNHLVEVDKFFFRLSIINFGRF